MDFHIISSVNPSGATVITNFLFFFFAKVTFGSSKLTLVALSSLFTNVIPCSFAKVSAYVPFIPYTVILLG